MKQIILLTYLLALASNALAGTGPYVSKIVTLQTSKIGHSYNTVHLTKNITDSPCSSTNAYNRFTITNNLQHSVILAALMTDKEITIYGSGSCNGANIETISDIRLHP